MLTLIAGIILAVVFFKLLGVVIKGTFGVLLVLGLLLFFPLIIVGLLAVGLAVIALPILIVVGIVTLAVRV
jgi:hypothetical protein